MKAKTDLQLKEEELYDEMGAKEDRVIRAKLDAISFLLGEGDPITDVDLPYPTSDADLDVLIKTLEQERENVPEYSYFGDPNWQCTDAQIAVVKWAKGK